MKRSRNRDTSAAVEDLNAWYMEETERALEEDVKHYWQASRDPHLLAGEDEGWCPCHEMHVYALKAAIKRLRAFRLGVYWA